MIKLVNKVELGLNNRDGYLFACLDKDGVYYLVLEANTFHNAEIFEGMGSTEHKRITKEAYNELIGTI